MSPESALHGSHVRVAVIGAGFGGVAAAVKLRRRGIVDFVVVEKSCGVGGTWWDNRYPGAEVDTPSDLYSFSFRPSRWTRTHTRQSELQGYIAEVVREYSVDRHLHLGVEVERLVWDEAGHYYVLHTRRGATFKADAVISAVGLLNVPREPNWPGSERFVPPRFHTARWAHDQDLTDKVVAVVGTGSTASQVVPALVPIARRILLFQREPGWVVPKNDRDLTEAEQLAWRPLTARWSRLKLLLQRERIQAGQKTVRPGSPLNKKIQASCETTIARVFADRPDLREAVTPKYPYGGKRHIISDAFYPSLLEPNVELIPFAVESLTECGVIDSQGVARQVDALIMATGFRPAEFLSTFEVVGRGGRTIHEVWGDDPKAFLGMMVPGFPNFFMLYGPNSNGGAIVTHLQLQASYAVSAIGRLGRRRASVEVKEGVMRRFDAEVQRRLQGTSWQIANNYYKSASGRVVTEWPEGAIAYGVLTKLLRRAVWTFHRRAIRPS